VQSPQKANKQSLSKIQFRTTAASCTGGFASLGYMILADETNY